MRNKTIFSGNNFVGMDNLTLESFVEKLLIEKGMGGLDPEVFAQLQADLADRLETLINAEILKRIPEDNLAEFDKLLDGEDEQALHNFCHVHIPNMEQMVAEVLIDARQAYLVGTL